MRISDWSSDVCSSDLHAEARLGFAHVVADRAGGQVQLVRGVGEILVAGRRGEHAERRQQGGAQVHPGPPWDTSLICGSDETYALVGPPAVRTIQASPP